MADGQGTKNELIGCGIFLVCAAIAFAIIISVIKYWNVKGFNL